MLELDEYEMDGIAKLLHIAKRFADRGRLDLLLQASGKDAILSVETYLELEYDLPCLIFEDVTVQRHPEDDWRMFSERTVYIMRDSLLSRFDQLCREYEATPASVRICRCIKRLIRISRSPALSSVFQSGPQTAL